MRHWSTATITFAAWQVHAEANRVKFLSSDDLVHYTTVRRGEVTEHIMTTAEAVAAVKKGQPIPPGTHFVLVDYRDGKVHRYFVMQNGVDWGKDFDEVGGRTTGSSNGSGPISPSTWTRTPPAASRAITHAPTRIISTPSTR